MTVTIYHNPRCSKSRKTLELIQSAGVSATIVEYLQNPPDAATIEDLAAMLGVPVADLLRRGEAAFKEADDLPDLGDNAALAAWLAQNPQALQRPIVVNTQRGQAVIGRPPENVEALFQQ